MTRPRIRSIKPEIWASEQVGALSDKGRLLYVGLVTMADDAGRLRVLPSAIIGHVFPWDETINAGRLRKLLDEIERVGLVLLYEIAGKGYLWIRGWREHQKINRPTPTRLPPPPNEPAASWFPHDDTPPPRGAPHDGFSEVVVNGSGAGRERSGSRAQAPTRADRIGSGNNPPNPPQAGGEVIQLREPRGKRQRDHDRFAERVAALAVELYPVADRPVAEYVAQAVRAGALTRDHIRYFVDAVLDTGYGPVDFHHVVRRSARAATS